jgi:hypothetical protein
MNENDYCYVKEVTEKDGRKHQNIIELKTNELLHCIAFKEVANDIKYQLNRAFLRGKMEGIRQSSEVLGVAIKAV